ncbi:hypothetical protein ABZ914_27950 [Spirillospora sp. NPDC046719]
MNSRLCLSTWPGQSGLIYRTGSPYEANAGRHSSTVSGAPHTITSRCPSAARVAVAHRRVDHAHARAEAVAASY